MNFNQASFKSDIKNFLYKKKRKSYQFIKVYLEKIFWEDNEDNLYYGHYNIFKTYTKSWMPLKIEGEVQHGWNGDNSGIANPDRSKKYYVFNKINEKTSLSLGYNNVVTIGAPFIYLCDIYKPKISFSPNSLILFPDHSTEWDKLRDPVKSYEKYLNCIKNIDHNFEKITVSLYYLEYKNEKIRNLFENQGYEIITMGHKDNNPNFLYNFYNAVSSHEYVTSNTYSTPIFYSLFIKKKAFIYGNNMHGNIKWHFIEPESKKKIRTNFYEHYKNIYPELLWENFVHKSYITIGQKELGFEHKKTPSELIKLFGWSWKQILSKILT